MVMEKKMQIMPDASGKIKEILLSAPGMEDPKELIETYGGLFESFGGTVKFLILSSLAARATRKEFEKEFVTYLQQYSPHEHIIYFSPNYTSAHTENEPTAYVQDPFVILQFMEGLPVFLEPFYFGKDSRGQDRHIAEQVSAHAGYLMKSTELHLEGGNIVADDNYAIIGRDTLMENIEELFGGMRNNAEELEEAENKLYDHFCSILGVDHVIWLGSETKKEIPRLDIRQGLGFQPLYHLDLYVTPGGKTENGDELVFVAGIDEQAIEGLPSELQASWRKVAAMLRATQDELKNAHRLRPGPRFDVEVIPMGFRIIDAPQKAVYPLSFNNCLLESYNGIKIAYLPQYYPEKEIEDVDLVELHGRVKEQFEHRGYKVKFVRGNFYEKVVTMASLHCISKVTKRSYCFS